MDDAPSFEAGTAIRNGLQSFFGAAAALLLVSSLGGAIPMVAGSPGEDLFESGPDFLLIWIAHWIVAGMCLWGLFSALVPVWCLFTLMEGTQPVTRVLAIALTHQILLSLGVIVLELSPLVLWEFREGRALAGSLVAIALVWSADAARARFRRRSQPAPPEKSPFSGASHRIDGPQPWTAFRLRR